MFKKEVLSKIVEPKSQKINVGIDPAKKVYNRTVYEVGSHRKNSVITTDNTITIKNLPFVPQGGGGGGGSIDSLKDVIIGSKVQGATLCYDVATDDYIVKPLDLAYVAGVLDGGEF